MFQHIFGFRVVRIEKFTNNEVSVLSTTIAGSSWYRSILQPQTFSRNSFVGPILTYLPVKTLKEITHTNPERVHMNQFFRFPD